MYLIGKARRSSTSRESRSEVVRRAPADSALADRRARRGGRATSSTACAPGSIRKQSTTWRSRGTTCARRPLGRTNQLTVLRFDGTPPRSSSSTTCSGGATPSSGRSPGRDPLQRDRRSSRRVVGLRHDGRARSEDSPQPVAALGGGRAGGQLLADGRPRGRPRLLRHRPTQCRCSSSTTTRWIRPNCYNPPGAGRGGRTGRDRRRASATTSSRGWSTSRRPWRPRRHHVAGDGHRSRTGQMAYADYNDFYKSTPSEWTTTPSRSPTRRSG